MTQRVVLGASVVLFGLLAMVAHLLADMHDRAFPVRLGASASIYVDFAESALPEDAAVATLRSWDARAGLGLVKESADLGGDLRGKVFIALRESTTLPETVSWYGDEPTARVVGPQAMAHALPSGTYLVTGRAEGLAEFLDDLRRQGVTVSRTDATLGHDLSALYRQGSLAIAVATGFVLLLTLVLYWLAARSRGRALRVLGGTSVLRIQLADITRFLFLITATGALITGGAVVVIGGWKGWAYAWLYASRLGALGALVLLLVLGAAAVLSAISAPSPKLIAHRKPATLGVRRAAVGMKLVTFGFVLLAIGPAFSAVLTANSTARELGQWNRLADQVRVAFKGVSEQDFQRLMPPFGALVREAEVEGSVALSYLITDDPQFSHGSQWTGGLGRWSGFALVNQRWLDLMRQDGEAAPLTEVPRTEVPPGFLTAFIPQLDIWKRAPGSSADLLTGFRYLTPGERALPLTGPGGDLRFRRDTLIIVVPGAWQTFNDSFLVSVASSGNVLFTGLEQTQARIDRHRVGREVKVQHAAADGILRAQFAAYEVWLGVISVIGLAVALVVAAAISAYIAALLAARNDFARRLAGHPWWQVLSGRLGPETAIGALVTIVALLIQAEHALTVLVTAVLLLALAPVAHVLAARRAFADVGARRL